LLNEVKYSSEELFISKGAIFIRPEEGEFLNQNSNVKSYYDSLKSEITTENYVKIIYSTNFSDNRTNTCLCIQHENLITGNNCSSFNLCCEVFLENI